ncbi:MAG: hypothetical protein DPW18_17340 [Chloroflexi bacterium]|nr:hypothetical protein [Chloroflexota bacterium]MDL1941039.1 hypothetical protein [Chloroflexi bacterium CFX2]
MNKHLLTIAIVFSIALPILGYVGGYWYGSQIDWFRLSSPPAQPSHIVGIGVENSPEGDFAFVIQTINGDWYNYREYGTVHWAETNEERVRWFEEGNEPCGATPRPFIPPPPGRVIECVEYYAGPYADQEPEFYVKQLALLDDGSVWKWSYPRSLIYAIIRRNILFGFFGFLAGGLLGATIIFTIRGSNKSKKSGNLG